MILRLHLAVILKSDQEYEAAKRHLQQALRVRPGDVRVLYQLGTISLATGEVEPARETLEAVVKEAPEFVEAHVSLATVYYRLKRKADGDRERAIVEKLNQEAQARQPKGTATP
jgi:Tfp pilus assembly protein PilF